MRRGLYAALVAVGGLVVACKNDLTIPNFNNPTPTSIAADPSSIEFAARGILFQNRATYGGFISDVGIFGRESYNYFPTDARSVSHYLAQNPLDPAGFASGGWNPRYQTMRNIFNFIQAVNATRFNVNEATNTAQKEAAIGWAETFEALELYYLITQRHNFGIVVQILPDVKQIAPFVSRDSAWNYIAGRLNEAANHLKAGSSVDFPFALTEGFTRFGNFATPSGFLKFNRGLKARVDITRASLRNPACGANGVGCYQSALSALDSSFISLNVADLNVGVYHVFSTEAGDIRNPLNAEVTKDFLAHPSITTDAAPGDKRYAAKIRQLPSPRGPSGGSRNGIQTNVGFQIYSNQTSPAPIMRNEELILIRSEARWFTGNKAGAISDLNFIRQNSGGLGPTSLTTGSTDAQYIAALLYERRYSLLWEGHRWADVRRFDNQGGVNWLNTLPLDLPTFFRQLQMPVPQAECDFRNRVAKGQPGLVCPTGPTGPTS